MFVYGVHVVRADEIGITELVVTDLTTAERWACDWSQNTDEGVLAAAVTRFGLDQPGTRRPVSLFVNGERQAVPYVSNCRRIHP